MLSRSKFFIILGLLFSLSTALTYFILTKLIFFDPGAIKFTSLIGIIPFFWAGILFFVIIIFTRKWWGYPQLNWLAGLPLLPIALGVLLTIYVAFGGDAVIYRRAERTQQIQQSTVERIGEIQQLQVLNAECECIKPTTRLTLFVVNKSKVPTKITLNANYPKPEYPGVICATKTSSSIHPIIEPGEVSLEFNCEFRELYTPSSSPFTFASVNYSATLSEADDQSIFATYPLN